MSNWGIEDDTNLGGDIESTGPKELRDAYKALKAQNKELMDGLASVQGELRAQKVAGTLSELGIPAAAAQQYKGDADPEKVREWATTMQSIFGGASGTPNTPSVDQQTPSIDPSTAAQMQRMNEAGQQGQPLGNAELAHARVNDANDIQGLLAAWQNLK